MAGLYSSQSGKYADFVTGKELTAAVKQQTDKQIQAQVVSTAIIASNQNRNTAAIIQNQNSNAKALQYTINQQTYSILASQAAMTKTFAAGFNAVNNTLTVGFDSVNASISNLTRDMNAGFEMLARSIDKMSQEICDRLDALHDIMNNPRRTQARELYRSAAKNAKSGLFEEALDDLKQAVEKEKTDYLSWFLKGQVELFGYSEFGNTINVSDAIESFMTAYKYVSADLATMTTGMADARKIAADICYHLAYAEYIHSNDLRMEENASECETFLEKAIEHYEKSLSFEKNNTTEYQLMRCQHLAGQNISAMAQIRSLVAREETKDYAFKILIDPDFFDFQEEIMKTIDEVRREKYKEALNEKEKFFKKFENLYYADKDNLDNLQKLKERDIPEDLSLFDCYEEILFWKYRFNDFDSLKGKEHLVGFDLNKVKDELDLFDGWKNSNAFTYGFYIYNDLLIYGCVTYSDPKYGGNGERYFYLSYLLGKLSYYTKDGKIIPCIILSESVIPNGISYNPKISGIYDHDGKVFKNSKNFNRWCIPESIETPIPEPAGEKKILAGIEVFNSAQFEDRVPIHLTKKHIQEIKEESERNKKQDEKDNRNAVISTIIVIIIFIGIGIFSVIKCNNML